MSEPQPIENSIAIIGMAGRFPGAGTLDEFWRNLCAGAESISFFSDEELETLETTASGENARYVKARGVLAGAELFDAEFFGLTPREAEVMDPQHRIFLECAWEALENAGCHPGKFGGAIGVFAGMSMNTYFAHNLAPRPDVVAQAGEYQVMLGNDKDFLATRVSYKLNLKGPSLNIQTACSTSLVAVGVACQHLLNGQCDAALAGGVSISFPQKRGHVAQAGGIGSPDGHCRVFDAQAAGTVRGEGVGIVVLKRLDDALANGDQIFAVIKGFAINNDGANKIGYTAPSVDGQAEVIAAAQAMAGVAPETISYVEAHGTATPLGDPIEVAGLTKAFHAVAPARKYCALGSVKSNIGHLDIAAGVAGLIKTALALQHKKIPPSLHFETANPKIDFSGSPFFVNTKLADWKNGAGPRRAGVSSFGIGGTNAHVVLEEAPTGPLSGHSRPVQLLLLSARTEHALDQVAANLQRHLRQHPEINLADMVGTLQLGRRDFAARRMLICRDTNEAVAALESRDANRGCTRFCDKENPPVVFMFPGQGTQHPNMGLELYRQEAVFREQVDLCAEMLKPELGFDLRTALYPEPQNLESATYRLTQTAMAQPALFVVEYALARLWMNWGIRPEAMIGHSLGEYVAACLAGVFSLDCALKLVAARGRLMQRLPPGTMLAVRLSEREIQPLLSDRLSLAAVNAPSLCVVSGATADIGNLQQELQERAVVSIPLQTSHAFHSAMMEPILPAFTELVASLERKSPQIPFISNLTGTWITAEQATDPAYWAKHLRQTVRFDVGTAELLKDSQRILLEVGPGQTLNSLVKQNPAFRHEVNGFSSLPGAKTNTSEMETLLPSLGRLWLAGVTVDWRGFYRHEFRRRVSLPAYPFERKRHFIEPAPLKPSGLNQGEPSLTTVSPEKAPDKNGRSSKPVETSGAPDQVVAELKTLLCDLSGLNLEGMKGTTTFTEIGFDSLFLTQVSLALGKKFGIQVAFRQLLEEFSTLDTLAAHVRQTRPATNGDHAKLPVPGSSSRENLPLTEAQRDLWFAVQMNEAASCVYNECRLLHLRGPLNTAALDAALQRLVERHEALRTTIAAAGDVQVVRPTFKLEVPFVDWSGHREEERVGLWDAAQAVEARGPFDLVNGPLVRARLFRFTGQHHVLMLTVHHIICDGHSLGTLLHELSEYYSATCQGIRPELPPAPQLADYVRDQSQADAARPADEAYWLRQLAGVAPGVELPTESATPLTWSFDGAREIRYLPAQFIQELRSLSAKQRCTLFTVLLAGYVALLRRLTGKEEVVVGIPVADRAREGGPLLVGHCVHLMPLCIKVSDDQPFVDYLAALQKTFFEAYEHRRYPIGSLVQKLNLSRERGRMPLAANMFNFEWAGDGLKFYELNATVATNPHGFTSFDLNLNATEINGALQLDCRYNTSLFSPRSVRRWLGHFQTLLEGAVANPQRTVRELPVLAAAERQKILLEWNQTQTKYPAEKCLHQLFEEQARRTPDAVAVIYGGQQVTYSELNRRADRLANFLRSLKVAADVPIGICLERTSEMVVGVLAVLKAGGAYISLDTGDSAERLAALLKNLNVNIILTQRSLLKDLQFSIPDLQRVCVDESWPSLPAGSQEGQPPGSTALACIIHTSGTTGEPKMVAIEHRNVVNLVCWAQGVFSREELAGVLFSTSLDFGPSLFELFVPLTSGGKIIVATNALEMADLPGGNDVTLINTLPAVARELLQMKAIPPSVRVMNLTGEPLTSALVEQLFALGTVRRIYDLYGPAETTIYSTYASREADGNTTIGRPIANTQIYILDAGRRPLPVGVWGEIYIGGAGVARGYRFPSDLAAGEFVTDPFSSVSAARLYRTGDLARWLPDGTIEFLGRADQQVRLHGSRMNLEAINSTLIRHPTVRECGVAVREDVPEEPRLVAYIVPEADQAETGTNELRDFLKQNLPEHMLPSAFVFLEALPRMSSGKIDRRALPTPEQTAADTRRTFSAPGTGAERALARIWCEVLRLEAVGVHDDFFDLGGHSLLIMQVLSRVREAFHIELSIHQFFDTPTIAGLAATIESVETGKAVVAEETLLMPDQSS